MKRYNLWTRTENSAWRIRARGSAKAMRAEAVRLYAACPSEESDIRPASDGPPDGMRGEQFFRVFLFDSTGKKPPKLAFSHAIEKHARRFVREWQRDPRGLTAIVWPLGAPAPRAVKGGR